MRFRTATHSLDAPVNNITRMDVVKTIDNLRQLVTGVSVG